jgi:hypothetical protein
MTAAVTRDPCAVIGAGRFGGVQAQAIPAANDPE